MARNVSRIKLAYYPLPPAEGTRLRNLIDFEPGASAVDPCAGTGAALHQLTEGANVDKHGVELDAGRATASAARGSRRSMAISSTRSANRKASHFST
jgi:uncharacterized methyltransferase DUF6094